MIVSRIVIKNYRSIKHMDVAIKERASCIIGENNTGKSNLINALRLCLDVNLSSSYRALLKEDVHCSIDQSRAFQVLIGVEFTGYEESDAEVAMLHGSQMVGGRARIFYRFRPRRHVREDLQAEQRSEDSLTLDDFSWELVGGGDPSKDLALIEWDDENDDLGARTIGLQYLQAYLVTYLHALRDVENDLQQTRRSPLARLIEASEISVAEQQALIEAVRAANAVIEESETIKAIAQSVDKALEEVTGPAFRLAVDLGLSAPTFQAIIRNINILLSNTHVQQFEPRRNGLGLNNILYIAILIELFRKRAAKSNAAGELILIEEPEAHLHPQLQLTLLAALRELPFQSIVTTHSTQVTSKASLGSFVLLTDNGTGAPYISTISQNTTLTPSDVSDLERYLDATKSNLLFARKVMLVEGAAEVFLIPALAKSVYNVDLDREGISVVAIHGVHFGPFARLFCTEGLPKKCAIVADADLIPLGGDEGRIETEGDGENNDRPSKPAIDTLEGPFVRAFLGVTTFEREITLEGNLDMLAKACRELGAVKVASKLELANIIGGEPEESLKRAVLNTARRFGKARFAQTVAKYVDAAQYIPNYIADAIDWLISE